MSFARRVEWSCLFSREQQENEGKHTFMHTHTHKRSCGVDNGGVLRSPALLRLWLFARTCCLGCSAQGAFPLATRLCDKL